MIKILAPTRNYEIARMQVEAGADELYMGVDAGDFNVYSYGGGFRRMNGVVPQVPSVEELAKISSYCGRRMYWSS